MNQKWKKVTAEVVCAALVVAGVGTTVFAVNNDKNADAKQETAAVSETSGKKIPGGAALDETVYVLADADGSVKKCIVSDWVDGTDKDDYTQQETQQKPPVEMSVKYLLDGVETAPDQMAGKSGKVKIRFDYTNNQTETVKINGKQETMHVPFAALTGILLDNNVFTNVRVTNGRVVNDGDRTLIVGIALPGLTDNLKLENEDVELPEYIEVSADVQNFEMANTMTLVTNMVFNEIDTDKLDSADGLKDAIGKMTDAMSQLMGGSNQLYDGLSTLYEKSTQLADGTGKLAAGASQLQNGAAQLNGGAQQLAGGSTQLVEGLDMLAANNDALNAGAGQIFDALLSVADTQLAEAGLAIPALSSDNYAEILNGVIASLDETNVAAQAQQQARAAVTQAVEAKRGEVVAAVTDAVKAQVAQGVTEAVQQGVFEKVLAAMGMTPEQYQQGVEAGVITAEQQAAVQAALDGQMASEEVQGLIAANVEAKMQSEEMQGLIAAKTEEQVAALIEQNMNSPEVQAKITAALEQARSGAAKVSALKEQLDSVSTFYTGLTTYTAGVATAKSGAHQLNGGIAELNKGAAQLVSGANALADGANTLNGNMPALLDGVAQLRDGDKKLVDGLQEFNKQGIQKLANLVDGDLDEMAQRLKTSIDISKQYRSFTDAKGADDSQVKFIYRTDSIG